MLFKPRQFPHPVLSFFSDDLVGCEYQCTVTVTSTSTTFNFDVVAVNSSQDINSLLKSKKASNAIHIDCPTTRYRQVFKFNDRRHSFSIDSRYLEGNVQVSRFVLAETDIESYSNSNFHSDYNGTSFSIFKGDILALNKSFTFDAEKELDPLKSIPSIFSIRLNKEDKAPAVDVQLSKKINIYLSEENYRKFKMLNQIQSLSPVVAQIVLIPALTMILEKLMHADKDIILEWEDSRWFKVLKKKLKDLNVDIDEQKWTEESSLLLSQKLIGEPISKSLEAIESIMEEV